LLTWNQVNRNGAVQPLSEAVAIVEQMPVGLKQSRKGLGQIDSLNLTINFRVKKKITWCLEVDIDVTFLTWLQDGHLNCINNCTQSSSGVRESKFSLRKLVSEISKNS